MKLLAQWPMYFIGRMLPAAIGFCGIALYTRAVDPASFGVYALLLSTAYLVGMVCFTWLRVATLRTMTSVQPADEADFSMTICISFVLTALIVAVATVGIVRVGNPRIPLVAELLTAAAAIASGWFELNVVVMQARMRVKTYGLLQAARAITALGTSLFLISLGLKANALLGGYVLGNCAGFATLSAWRPALHGRFRVRLFRQLFLFGWPSSASSLTYLSSTFQRFMLTGAAGSASLGVFAAATDFSNQTIGLLMGTVLIAGQPLAFRARDHGTGDQLSAQLRTNARLLFAVGLGTSAGLIALSTPIAHLYFGSRFQTNTGLILAISAGTIFMSAFRGYYFEQAFEIARETRPVAIIAAFRTALTIALSVMLIARAGAVGAAVAMAIAEFCGLIVSLVWSVRLMQVPMPMLSFAKIAAATAAMMSVMALLPSRPDTLGFATSVLAGGATYAVVFALIHARQLRRMLGTEHPICRWLSRA